MKHKILFVDDEENILKALQRLLRKGPYDIFLASSAIDAFKCLKENEISVLVTDMRMPDMNGVDLIIEANKISPLTIKTILSGYSDINDIMTAINSGHVHNYITKPWNEAELMISLMNAAELYERRVNEKNLLQELNKKNEELKLLNESLEKRVKQRTWELSANNLIMNSILEGEDQQSIMNRIADFISKLSGERQVSVWVKYQNEIYGADFLDSESEVFKQGLKKKTACILNNVLVLPEARGDDLLGILFIENVKKGETGFIKRIESLQAILRMYIAQKALLANPDDVIGSIDFLLGNIDG